MAPFGAVPAGLLRAAALATFATLAAIAAFAHALLADFSDIHFVGKFTVVAITALAIARIIAAALLACPDGCSAGIGSVGLCSSLVPVRLEIEYAFTDTESVRSLPTSS